MSRHAHRLQVRSALLTLVMVAAFAGDAKALAPRAPEELDRRVLPAPFVLPILEQAEEGGTGPGASAAARFRQRHPGPWTVTFDRRTGRPSPVEGAGIPLFPGRGNSLTAAAAGLARAPGRLEDVEPLGRAFLDDEGDFLRPRTGELRLNPDRSAWLEDGALVYLDYDWFVDGIPVEGARG